MKCRRVLTSLEVVLSIIIEDVEASILVDEEVFVGLVCDLEAWITSFAPEVVLNTTVGVLVD